MQIYIIRGNHDDPSWFDGRYNGRWSNITLVPDYTVLRLEHQNYLFIGGALSVDRLKRTEGRDYWKDEVFNYDEDKLREVLKECKPIDIVVTHTAPDFCYPWTGGALVDDMDAQERGLGLGHLKLELQVERQLMTRAYNVICEYGKPKKYIYGHFHESKVEYVEDVEFRLLGIGELTNI